MFAQGSSGHTDEAQIKTQHLLPETAQRVFGDGHQRFVQGHEHGTEITDLLPFVAVTPPHDLDRVALARGTQAGGRYPVILAE